jgi:hypothetical protein
MSDPENTEQNKARVLPSKSLQSRRKKSTELTQKFISNYKRKREKSHLTC